MNNLNIIYDYCIYGGSFNPITVGHILVLSKIYDLNIAHMYLIMPCCPNSEKTNLIEPTHRINLCNIALEQNFPSANNLKVSDFEIKYGLSESYITYLRLKEKYPNKSFVFVIGSDVLPQIPKWPMGLQFAKSADFIIATRPEYPINNSDLEYLNKYYLLDNLLDKNFIEKEVSAASSTEARRSLATNDHIRSKELLIDGVIEYIKNNNLYK